MMLVQAPSSILDGTHAHLKNASLPALLVEVRLYLLEHETLAQPSVKLASFSVLHPSLAISRQYFSLLLHKLFPHLLRRQLYSRVATLLPSDVLTSQSLSRDHG